MDCINKHNFTLENAFKCDCNGCESAIEEIWEFIRRSDSE